MIKQCRQVVLASLCFFVGTNVFAADSIKLYRYINEKGELILSNEVPPDNVRNGYDVLDSHGKVTARVDPELTQEQRDAKVAEAARKEHDKKIMSLYASYDDLDRVRNLEVEKINAAITITEENIKGLIKRRETLQKNAADMERTGKKVSADITLELVNIDNTVKSENIRLIQQQEEKKKLIDTYGADRVRLGELRNLAKPTKISGSDELKPLEALSNKSSESTSNTPIGVPSKKP